MEKYFQRIRLETLQEENACWQEVYMEQLIGEYAKLLVSSKPASEKFWTLNERICKDQKHIGVQVRMSRSTMINNLIVLLADGLISFENIKDFSPALQEHLKLTLEYLGH